MISRLRLLPIVIAAVAALLLLKTLGLVSDGYYALSGPVAALASEGAAAPEGGDGAEHAAVEPQMVDTTPVATDAGGAAADGHGAAPAAEHGAAPAAEHGAAPAPAAEHGAAPSAEADSAEPPCEPLDPVDSITPVTPAAGGHGAEKPAEAASAGEHGAPAADPAAIDFAKLMEKCKLDAGTTAEGDALPIVQGSGGEVVPIADTVSPGAEAALTQRLDDRRAELAAMEDQIAGRQALLNAAEDRIKEREASLAQLEGKITAMLDQRTEAEAQQIAQVVALYESMKPKSAAMIFDGLDDGLLVKVAKAMSPKKLAPVLAAMDPAKAALVTVGLATVEGAAVASTAAAPGQLPQIVGN